MGKLYEIWLGKEVGMLGHLGAVMHYRPIARLFIDGIEITKEIETLTFSVGPRHGGFDRVVIHNIFERNPHTHHFRNVDVKIHYKQWKVS